MLLVSVNLIYNYKLSIIIAFFSERMFLMRWWSSIFQLILEPNNWSVDNVLSLISILVVIVGGLFAFFQWHLNNKTKRTELIDEIIRKLRFDKEMAETMYIIDYDSSWYNGFHNRTDDFEYRIDKLLSYLTFICYLYEEKNLKKEEFRVLQYEINRACTSYSVQSYLWNLYHFSQKQGTECSFQYLIDYGIKSKLIDESVFMNPESELYKQKLNF